MISNNISIQKTSKAVCLFLLIFLASGTEPPQYNWSILNTDDTLGVYVSGKRVGRMVNIIESVPDKKKIRVKSGLEIKYSGISTGSSFMKQNFTYNYDGNLIEAVQTLESVNGISSWHAYREDANGWMIEVTAGGEKRSRSIDDVKDNLRNEYDIQTDILNNKIETGDIWSDTVFDLNMGKNKIVETVCVNIIEGEDGKAERFVFENRDKSMNLTENMVLDNRGRPLEVDVPPIFKAKRDTEEIDKKDEYVDFSRAFKIEVEKNPGEDEVLKIDLKKNISLNESVSGFYREYDNGYVLDFVNKKCNGKKTTDKFSESLLQPTVIMQSDNKMIKSLSDSLCEGVKTRCDKIDRLNSYVFNKIDKVNVASFSSALETLKAGKGDCGEHAVLLGALLRAAGIESGVVTGIVHIPSRGGCFYHEWVYVKDDNGWLFSDPAFGKFPVSEGYLPLIIDNTGEYSHTLAGIIGKISVDVVKR